MITVHMAAMKEREESLKDTIESLIDQVDKINVFLHDYFEVPEFLCNEKIQYMTDEPEEDNGDLGKFSFPLEEGYHLHCDDDLVYPEDYVSKTIEAIDSYDREAIVSFCGGVPKRPPIGSYYIERTAISLFEDLEEDKMINIPGTGVMGYHTDLIKEWDFKDKAKNMADIHVGIYAKEKEIPVVCVKHAKEWIKHSLKVDLKKTIFHQNFKRDAEQTDLINKHFAIPREFNDDMPKVSIIVVNTRQLGQADYVSQCMASLREQSYPNIEIVVVKNYEKLYTVGKCWNDGIRASKGDYLLFVGDDDYLSPDYVASLASIVVINPEDNHFSTHLTMFCEKGKGHEYELKPLIPTGLWRKDYLIENPPIETMVKFVDVKMIDGLRDKKLKQHVLKWHHGYFYRSHAGQVSGRKLMEIMKNEHKHKRAGLLTEPEVGRPGTG